MKNLLILLTLFCLPFAGKAQRRFDSGNTELGFTVSPNLGWLRVTNPQNTGIKGNGSDAGVSYGVLADLGFARNYYFSTAFVVTSINAKLSQPTSPGAGAGINTTAYKIQYVEIPLTLKLKTTPSDMGRFYGQFGLGTGVKISGKQSTNGQDKQKSNDANTLRLSLIAGAGAEWNINSDFKIQTGLTLNRGLSNTISSQYDVRSDYVALNLGIFF